MRTFLQNLDEMHGNISRAAALSGVSRFTVYKCLRDPRFAQLQAQVANIRLGHGRKPPNLKKK